MNQTYDCKKHFRLTKYSIACFAIMFLAALGVAFSVGTTHGMSIIINDIVYPGSYEEFCVGKPAGTEYLHCDGFLGGTLTRWFCK
ncbi:MAG: hypothetical protein WC523_04220 [Patescibacteria group bacterium]